MDQNSKIKINTRGGAVDSKTQPSVLVHRLAQAQGVLAAKNILLKARGKRDWDNPRSLLGRAVGIMDRGQRNGWGWVIEVTRSHARVWRPAGLNVFGIDEWFPVNLDVLNLVEL